MPSTYAHYRFGRDVWKHLPEEFRKDLSEYQNLYKIGLHGPDIFFYYHAYIPNKVTRTGYQLHDRKARGFFLASLQLIRHSQTPCNSLAMRAYIYGFICHFVLDSECHPYVAEHMKNTGISHMETEVEFDRMLMVNDKIDPVRHRLTGHIQISPSVADTIHRFFPQLSDRKICRSLKSMKLYDALFLAPGPCKRHLILFVLKLIKRYDELHGMLVNLTPNPACSVSNQELLRRYHSSIDTAVELIMNFHECESDIGSALSPRFNRTFEAEHFPDAL